MKLSARNQWSGFVESVTDGVVTSEVTVRLSEQQLIVATVTTGSVRRLGLEAGAPVTAIVKASSVIVGAGPAGRTSARNQLTGPVSRIERGAVQGVVTLSCGDGIEVTSTLTLGSLDSLGLQEGDQATALIKASHVLLAVDA